MKKGSKGIWIAVIALLIIITGIFAIRMFSQEDDWICRDGVWVKHGEPSANQPDSPCQ